MLRNTLLIIFFVFALFYIFFIDVISIESKMIFKLIPMLTLIIIAITTKVHLSTSYKTLLCIGLIFCSIGDYSLQWFIIGLSSFLIGHVFYILAFHQTNERSIPTYIKILLALYGLTMIIWVSGTLWQRADFILAIAVTVYILIILTMGLMSFKVGSSFAIIGALLFICSDTVLAINRFIYPIEYSHQLIMFTYYGAQLLLALSIAKYNEAQQKVVQ